jgi:hypothetical protein
LVATIIIKDEVNCNVSGLSLSDRKTLVNKFKYEIPGAKYQPSVRLGRWDGKVSYFQLGGSTYINLLPEILPFLESHDYEVEIDDQRQYSTQFEFNQVTETTFANRNWPVGHPAVGTPVLIRDYQVGIVNTFLSNPQSVQEIATGAGKCHSATNLLTINVDETTSFGAFLLNKLQQEQVNDVTRDCG